MAHGDDTDDSGGLGSGRRTAIERSRGRGNLYAITDSDECSVVTFLTFCFVFFINFNLMILT